MNLYLLIYLIRRRFVKATMACRSRFMKMQYACLFSIVTELPKVVCVIKKADVSTIMTNTMHMLHAYRPVASFNKFFLLTIFSVTVNVIERTRGPM